MDLEDSMPAFTCPYQNQIKPDQSHVLMNKLILSSHLRL